MEHIFKNLFCISTFILNLYFLFIFQKEHLTFSIMKFIIWIFILEIISVPPGFWFNIGGNIVITSQSYITSAFEVNIKASNKAGFFYWIYKWTLPYQKILLLYFLCNALQTAVISIFESNRLIFDIFFIESGDFMIIFLWKLNWFLKAMFAGDLLRGDLVG